jgi:Lar family restriction alleviation protein
MRTLSPVALDATGAEAMTKLLPCPFCGGDDFGWQVRHGLRGHRWVECTTCDAHGPVVVGADAAITAWNRRAPTNEGNT